MSFDQATITGVTLTLDGADLLIAWTSSDTPPVFYQAYVAGSLVYAGQGTRTRVPYPGPTGTVQVEVGTVGIADLNTDYSGSLPALPGSGNRAVLTWLGGSYLDATGADDVAGFEVFGSDTAGGSIDYAKVLATIPAYAGGVPLDGFGMGGFGQGGFGKAASSYTWTSGQLTSGVWGFAVKVVDAEGNLSGGHTTTLTIATAPNPPAESAPGVRLTRTFSPTTHKATLNWLASP